MSLKFRTAAYNCLCAADSLCKASNKHFLIFLSLTRGPIQRHDVRLPLHGALSLPGPRHQRAVGGRSSDCKGRLRGPRLDRRRPRVGPQGEPDQPGQALPGRAGTALVWSRPRPGSGPLPGDEPPPGQQDPPPKVPLLP